MTDSERESFCFSKDERRRIMSCVKIRRFDSDKMYELYEKVSEWCYEADNE